MLDSALRLLTMVRSGELLDALSTQVRVRAREAARTAGLYGLALILVIFGGIFVAIAVMLGLATVWPMHWAALTVGGLLIAAAGLVLLWIQPRQSRVQAPPPVVEQPPPRPELAELVRPVEAWAQRHPEAATFGAVVAGIVVGLLSGERPDHREHPPDYRGRW